MTDRFGRAITYARLSLTEACNLRCRYCMPPGRASVRPAMDDRQVEHLVQALAAMGVRKIRFTGGEPLVRPGVRLLLERVCRQPGIDWAITTNGTTLARDAEWLCRAGVTRVNISLDTLDAADYQALTGGNVQDARRGIETALTAGFRQVRLNAVLVRGVSEGQIAVLADWTRDWPVDVRFIELMPMGTCQDWAKAHFLPARAVREALPELQETEQDAHAPAHYFRLPGAKGRVGLITPLSGHFCAACNRIRITFDGKLKPCLHSNEEIDLRPALDDPAALQELLRQGVQCKPERHHLCENQFIRRDMSQIGG